MNSYSNLDDLISAALNQQFSIDPYSSTVVGAFAIQQSTRFPNAKQTYKNYYILFRVETAFGGCCVEASQLDGVQPEGLAGSSIAELLDSPILAVRIAALDAYLALCFPHEQHSQASTFTLTYGTPYQRAVARDEAIVSLLNIKADEKVGLIGVVNPIVDQIEKSGGQCLPCDFNLQETASGIKVTKDMGPLLAEADSLIVTGMTLSNGSFDGILSAANERQIPLLVYAQTGSSIVPRFLGQGVSAVCAEPFPYSQFSADPTCVYLYRAS